MAVLNDMITGERRNKIRHPGFLKYNIHLSSYISLKDDLCWNFKSLSPTAVKLIKFGFKSKIVIIYIYYLYNYL